VSSANEMPTSLSQQIMLVIKYNLLEEEQVKKKIQEDARTYMLKPLLAIS